MQFRFDPCFSAGNRIVSDIVLVVFSFGAAAYAPSSVLGFASAGFGLAAHRA